MAVRDTLGWRHTSGRDRLVWQAEHSAEETPIAAQLHYWLALASGAACLLVALEAGWRALRGAPVGRLAEGLNSVFLLALIVASAGGLGVVVGGGGPRESLHYIYTVIAVGLLPISATLTQRMKPRTRAAVTFVVAIVALVVIARLFQTG